MLNKPARPPSSRKRGAAKNRGRKPRGVALPCNKAQSGIFPSSWEWIVRNGLVGDSWLDCDQKRAGSQVYIRMPPDKSSRPNHALEPTPRDLFVGLLGARLSACSRAEPSAAWLILVSLSLSRAREGMVASEEATTFGQPQHVGLSACGGGRRAYSGVHASGFYYSPLPEASLD